ncbi:nuclear transport factor 2 family protein [Mycobacterium stomatepiae]|uniref:SnoaL-like domain-containing protein n=2 Tax=Mycobacterium stomatepiae TaxID=470076 RepID=A0A7I7QH34_9MYCO|nr:nuclear transport factor 2 family protein [Mycobacterium stomatepiae]BBY25645.1 hypothetical protein MSTO_58500 [Mycobacterium stomatepiae]
MTVLAEYMDAWVAADPLRIVATVTDDCVITECYGPIYRGRNRVRDWAETWFETGGQVHSWRVTDVFSTDNDVAAQWVFDYTWNNKRRRFEGATIARLANGLIAELREYETSAELYEWTGSWRTVP